MRYGVKAALTDAREMATLDVELLEVHLRLEDLPRHTKAVVDTFRVVRSEFGHDLVVHAPEFMPVGGAPTLVDLSSADGPIHQMSVQTLEATLDLARDVEAHLIVIHPGGIYETASHPLAEGGIDRLRGSLQHLGDLAREDGLLLTLENMPWFYNLKPLGGGTAERWESTILVAPDDMGRLSDVVDGMTLDVSHGFLHNPRGDSAPSSALTFLPCPR
jgi:sugar phosphate isomerase/epimerase